MRIVSRITETFTACLIRVAMVTSGSVDDMIPPDSSPPYAASRAQGWRCRVKIVIHPSMVRYQGTELDLGNSG